jgi:hypothetical protein
MNSTDRKPEYFDVKGFYRSIGPIKRGPLKEGPPEQLRIRGALVGIAVCYRVIYMKTRRELTPEQLLDIDGKLVRPEEVGINYSNIEKELEQAEREREEEAEERARELEMLEKMRFTG